VVVALVFHPQLLAQQLHEPAVVVVEIITQMSPLEQMVLPTLVMVEVVQVGLVLH
jgi:hypothetical protein